MHDATVALSCFLFVGSAGVFVAGRYWKAAEDSGLSLSPDPCGVKLGMIKDLHNILDQLDEVEFAYLFGSRARADERKDSDIDIAVYLKKEKNDFDTKLKVHHFLEKNLHISVDLVILNEIKNFNLLENIFEEGILIKDSKDDSRLMFELYKEHEIKDYKVFRKFVDVA